MRIRNQRWLGVAILLFMAAPVPDPYQQEVRRVERRALLDAETAAA